jgi:phosphohistidine phosphatase SixA
MMVTTRQLVCASVLAGFAAGAFAPPSAAQDAVFIVRHAERQDDSKDSPLSAAGQARAARLADMLRAAGITAIFATEYVRTFDTAKPLADRLGLTVQRVPAADTSALVARVRALGPTARVLLAGHSNTVPDLLKALGCAQPVEIAADEYDNLFVVVPHDKAPPTMLRLKY